MLLLFEHVHKLLLLSCEVEHLLLIDLLLEVEPLENILVIKDLGLCSFTAIVRCLDLLK